MNYLLGRIVTAILGITLFVTSVTSMLLAQGQDNRLLYGESLANFSITKSCCGDEGYVVAGTQLDNGTQPKNIKVTKVDGSGNVIWSKELNKDQHERVFHIEAVADGYALTGWVRGPAPSKNRLSFIRLDPSGNVIFSKIIEDLVNPNWQLGGTHVIEVNNGGSGYLVAGIYGEDATTTNPSKSIALIRLDLNGNLVWGKLFDAGHDGRADFDYGAHLVELDRGFYITGSCNLDKGGGVTNQGVLSMKVDFNGNLLWARNFAIAPGTDIHKDADLGTGAFYDETERVIVVSSNTTQSTNFCITKVDPNTGNIVDQRHYDSPEKFTPSYYIGKTHSQSDDSYLVSGLIAKSPSKYDCDGNPIENSTIPYLIEVSADLNTVISSYKYPMYAPTFESQHPSIFFSHFGMFSRPLAITPEMAYTDPDVNKTVFVAYRQDNPLPSGGSSLQFISNQSPDYQYCQKEDLFFQPKMTSPILSSDIDAQDFNDLNLETEYPYDSENVLSENCNSTSKFPIIQAASTSSDEVVNYLQRTMVVKDGFTYVGGGFYDGMYHADQLTNPNPSQSLTSSNDRMPWFAKYDVEGNFEWQIKAEGNVDLVDNTFITAVDVDDNHNVYISGIYSNQNQTSGFLQFDGDPNPFPSTETVASFIIKYNSNGVFQWSETFDPIMNPPDNTSEITIRDLVHADDGYLYITGYTTWEVGLNLNGTYTVLQTSPGYYYDHAFVGKVDPSNGESIYLESEGSNTSSDLYPKLATQIVVNSGNLYVGGYYTGSSPNPGGNPVPYAAPFIMSRKASDGSSTGFAMIEGVPTAPLVGTTTYLSGMDYDNGSVYACGHGSEGFELGSGSGATFSLKNDGWVTRIDASNGNNQQQGVIKNVAPNTNETVYLSDIDVHSSGDAYVLGSASDDCSWNGCSFSVSGVEDVFLAKYNNSLSSCLWTNSYGGVGNTSSPSTVVEDDYNCGVMISGGFDTQIDLGYTGGSIPAPNSAPACFVSRVDDVGTSYSIGSNSSNGVTAQESRQVDWMRIKDNHDDHIKIYPNPANDLVHIENIEANSAITIFNSSGRSVRTYTNVSEGLTIKRSGLNEGIYFLRITNNGIEVETQKIVFE